MKKSLLKLTHIFLCASVSCIIFMPVAWGQYERVKPWVPPQKEINVPDDYKIYMIEAMKIHSAQYQLNNLMMTTHPNKLLSEKEFAVKQEQMDALNACNVKRLSAIYKNPEEAWDKITKAYDDKEREMVAHINASVPAEQENDFDSAFPQWRVGRDVLIDVYANPEKYGELISGDDKKGFQRWKDQEYIYIEKVNEFLEEVVSVLGVNRIPGVSRENSYEQNAAAYQSFLNNMKVTDARKYEALSDEMLSFPQPPAPLPPANELIKLTTESTEGKLFPKMPDPWQEYVKNNKIKRLPDGEMSEYYQPNSLKLRTEVGYKTLDNRLNVYQEKRSEVINSKKIVEVNQEAEAYFTDEIHTLLGELNIDMAIDLENMDDLKSELRKQKEEKIEKALALLTEKSLYDVSQLSDKMAQFRVLTTSEKLVALEMFDRQSPEYTQALNLLNASQQTQDEVFLKAMLKDKEGTVMLSSVNAKDVEKLMKSIEAQGALAQTVYEKQENEIEKQKMKKIDSDCLNGGL